MAGGRYVARSAEGVARVVGRAFEGEEADAVGGIEGLEGEQGVAGGRAVDDGFGGRVIEVEEAVAAPRARGWRPGYRRRPGEGPRGRRRGSRGRGQDRQAFRDSEEPSLRSGLGGGSGLVLVLVSGPVGEGFSVGGLVEGLGPEENFAAIFTDGGHAVSAGVEDEAEGAGAGGPVGLTFDVAHAKVGDGFISKAGVLDWGGAKLDSVLEQFHAAEAAIGHGGVTDEGSLAEEVFTEDIFHGGFGEDGAVAFHDDADVGEGGDGEDDGGSHGGDGGEGGVSLGEAPEAPGGSDAAGSDGFELEEAFEVLGEVGGGGVAVGWSFGESFEDDGFEVAGDAGVVFTGGDGVALGDLFDEFGGGTAFEGGFEGE